MSSGSNQNQVKLMQQISVVPAGCQPWYRNHVLTSFCQPPVSDSLAGSVYLAYTSTMTIHILQVKLPALENEHGKSRNGIEVEFKQLITPFEANLTGCLWHSSDPDSWILACTNRKLHFGKWPTLFAGSERFSELSEWESKISVPWMALCPQQPSLCGFQSDVRCLKLLDISQMDSPQLVLTINHDGSEITTCRWRQGLAMTLFVADIGGSVYSYEISAGDDPLAKKYKVTKKRLNGILSTAKVTLHSAISDETETIYDSKDSQSTIIDLKFDPNNDAYLLVAFKYGSIMVYDVAQDSVIATFQRAASQLSSAEWIPTIPGGFITCDARVGIVKLWNVSQKAPLEIMKLLNSPVHISSALYTGSIVDDKRFDPVKGLVFFAFDDGSIGIYDFSKSSWNYLRHGGHTETIFCADPLPIPSYTFDHHDITMGKIPEFKHQNQIDLSKLAVLATCSYDGTVKMWDIGLSTLHASKTMIQEGHSCINNLQVSENQLHNQTKCRDFTLIDTFPTIGGGRKKNAGTGMDSKYGILYSVSWASDGSYRWVTGGSKGICVVYDAKNCRVIGEYNMHIGTCYRVAWNPFPDKKTDLIASVGKDGIIHIWKPENGQIIKSINLPHEVFGVSWSPLKNGLLAVGGINSTVYVMDIFDKTQESCIQLQGHKERVFYTVWSPLVPGLLASAADDNDARIWRTDMKQCITVLKGHKKKIRCATWHPEISALILTGSWDSDIRIWNVFDGDCLQIIGGHSADIYSICSFGSSPFVFTSVSRDNSIRLWAMESIAKSIQKSILEYLLRDDERGAVAALTGKLSKIIVNSKCSMDGPETQKLARIISSPNFSKLEKIISVLKLFDTLGGESAFMRALAHVSKEPPSKLLKLDPIYHDGFSSILTPADFVSSSQIKAQSMEPQQLIQRIQSNRLNIPKLSTLDQTIVTKALSIFSMSDRNDMMSILKASRNRLLANDLQSYCESLCFLGHWDRAMSLAPAVSFAYWQQLLSQYIAKTSADSTENDLDLPFLIAGRQYDKAIESLLRNGNQGDAYLLASSSENSGLISKVADEISHSQSSDGMVSQRLAAVWKMVTGDFMEAIKTLESVNLTDEANLIRKFT